MKTEFFTDRSKLTKEIINMKSQREYRPFSHMTDNDIKILHARLLENDRTRACILSMKKFGIENIEDQVAQFIICNWGELDHIPDIDDSDNFHFEYVYCGCKPNRCPFNMMFCVRKTKFQ